MIHSLPLYVTVEAYAKLCGIKTYTVYKRVKKGRATLFYVGSKRFIDLADNPVVKNFHSRRWRIPRPHPSGMVNMMAAPQVGLPTGLVSIKEIAEKEQIRADSIYEMVIADRLDAWQLAGMSFVKEDEYRKLLAIDALKK